MRAERTTNDAEAACPPKSMTKPGPPPGAATAAGDIGTARVRSGDGDRTDKVTATPPPETPIRSSEIWRIVQHAPTRTVRDEC